MGLTQKLGTIPQVSANYLPKSLSGSFANSLIQDDGSTTTITGASETLRLTTTGASNYFAYRNSSNTQIGDIGYDGRDTDGLSIWNNVSNGNLVFGAGAARRMTITSTGNVGIGTSSPGQKLVITTSGGSPSINIFDGTSDCYLGIATSANGYANGAAAGDFVVRGASGLAFSSNNGSTTAMRITSAGAINIKDGTLTGGGGFEFTSEAFFGARFQSNAYKFMACNNST